MLQDEAKRDQIKMGRIFPRTQYIVAYPVSFVKKGILVCSFCYTYMYIQDIYIRDRYMKILATFSWLQIKVGLLLFRMKLFSFQCIFQLWVYIIFHNCAKTVADVRYILKHEDEEEIRRIKLQVVQPIPYRDRQYISKDCMT